MSIATMTVCDTCNSETGSRYYKRENIYICQACACKEWRAKNQDRVKEYNDKRNPINHPKRFTYKGKRILLKENPRVGVCNLCRAVVPFDSKETHLHHEQYHDDDPLKDAIEICASCHTYETWRLGQYANRGY